MLVNSLVWSVLLASAGFASADDAPKQVPKEQAKSNVITSQGCFSSNGNMTETKLLSKYASAGVSSGNCRDTCQTKGFFVMALATQSCYCGRLYPPEDDEVKDKFCTYRCDGFNDEVCGGIGGYSSVFNLGVQVEVGNYEPESSSSTSSAPSEKTSSVDKEKTSAPASEATTTDSASSAPSSGEDNDDGDSGPSIGAIVGGVVGGVVVLGALIGAMVFFMRRRRNAEIEEEHRRNAAVNAFINGAKPPGSSGSISMTDSRLDPVMAHRRLSDGSIADNQDYSRRILRVTNA